MKQFMMFCMCAAVLASCSEKKEPVVETQAPQEEVVYQPVHNSETVDLKTALKYSYYDAPYDVSAASVVVTYDRKLPYAQPVIIKFSYANGDSFTYTIPAEFGLWKNEAGRFRVVTDDACTVWIQGQTKNGKFHEFVFYGDPRHNGGKIKPNSYRNLPAGEIQYRQ